MSYLLVPGTGGSKLLKNGEDSGYPGSFAKALGMSLIDAGALVEWTDLLSMVHRSDQVEPVRTSMVEGSEISGGPVLTAAYNLVPERVTQFRYDWRADLRYSADRLLQFLVTRRLGNTKWRLIAHSQGGLLIVIASKRYAEGILNPDRKGKFSDLVKSAVLVGVPLHGTLNAAKALVDGKQVGKANSFINAIRTWPAIYQMLPDWSRSLIEPDGTAVRNSLLNNRAWEAYPGIDPDLLRRARETHSQYLRNAFAHLGDVEVTTVLSTNHPTWDHAVLGGIEFPGIEFPERAAAGDSLVPYEATYRWMSAEERTTIKRLDADKEATIAEHSMLFTDPYVNQLVGKVVEW